MALLALKALTKNGVNHSFFDNIIAEDMLMIYSEDLVAAALLKQVGIDRYKDLKDQLNHLDDVTDDKRQRLNEYFNGARKHSSLESKSAKLPDVADKLNFLATAELANALTNQAGEPLDTFEEWATEDSLVVDSNLVDQANEYFNRLDNNQEWMDSLATAYQVKYEDSKELVEGVNAAIARKIAEAFATGDKEFLAQINRITGHLND